ncbi:hypothetical protein GCM10010413_34690 [Promicromonospora sukumoe]|uniref:Uncharacterized protein n=1 Tax=Promicromonospora sukumoe TaxID=88382 RepID=A0A7W3J783_9MICO|nr:hypothetical protein [Promicromonospora sukumoe]MBA8807414.1 hypothetical protein [Promicromonospora sukumoe]
MTQTTTAAGQVRGDGAGDTASRTARRAATDENIHGAAPVSRARAAGRFLAHLAEMVVVMVLGMLALAPAWDLAGAALGVEAVLGRPDVGAVVMVLDMVAAMTVWMRVRRHSWAAIWEMNAAMAAPFAMLLVLFWAGVATSGDLMLWGHVLMVPAMAGAMLLRPAEYTQHVHGFDLAWLGRRWPVLLGLALLALTVAGGVAGLPPWLILLVALVYPVVGLVRRSIRGRSMLLLQAAGLAVFAGVALLATVLAGQDTGAYVVAAGLVGHAVWDAFHHRAGAVVWRWYAETCVVYDVLLAAAVVATTLAP